MTMTVSKCRHIELPRIEDKRGNLTFIEENRHIPFQVRRGYYLYDVPGRETRGGHAHKHPQQFIIATNGIFDVVLDDGSLTSLRGYSPESTYVTKSRKCLHLLRHRSERVAVMTD